MPKHPRSCQGKTAKALRSTCDLVLLNSVSTDFVLSPTKYGFRKQDAILVLPDPSVGRRADIDASEPAQAGEGLRNPRRKQIKGQAC